VFWRCGLRANSSSPESSVQEQGLLEPITGGLPPVNAVPPRRGSLQRLDFPRCDMGYSTLNQYKCDSFSNSG
jgi:hypothetical protein